MFSELAAEVNALPADESAEPAESATTESFAIGSRYPLNQFQQAPG